MVPVGKQTPPILVILRDRIHRLFKLCFFYCSFLSFIFSPTFSCLLHSQPLSSVGTVYKQEKENRDSHNPMKLVKLSDSIRNRRPITVLDEHREDRNDLPIWSPLLHTTCTGSTELRSDQVETSSKSPIG